MPFQIGQPLNIALTGAAGQISYSLLPFLLDGSIFGSDKMINISLLEIPKAMEVLEGVKMELEDCCFSNLNEIKITSSADDAFMDADLILLIGSIPRKQGMERRDLIRVNTKIFKDHAEAIGRSASKDAKVVVIGNPINTNAWIIRNYGSNLDPANITALMQLDQSRAEGHLQMLSNRARSADGDHLPITVWGNHSKMVYPDISELEGSPQKKTSFLNLIRDRGSMVIKRRGLSSALSAAQAIKIHLTNLWKGSPHCTMAVYTGTEGLKELAIPGDLYFGMPVKILSPFKWEYDLENISINDTLLREIQNSVKELIEEKEEVIGI